MDVYWVNKIGPLVSLKSIGSSSMRSLWRDSYDQKHRPRFHCYMILGGPICYYLCAHLSIWPAIINRVSPSDNFHEQNTKAIYITPFIQQPSACILWCNIPLQNKEKLPSHYNEQE